MSQVGTPGIAVDSTSWHGSLQLEFARHQGRTQLSRCQVRSPLKVQRSFYPEGDVCHSVVLHTAGGMVGGDRLSIDIHLQPQAQALVTTAAASKIYRSTGAIAQQSVRVQVAPGACLEWLPQETIVFNGAIYRQDLRVELAADATWLGWEITRLGRTARGEQFRQGEWRSRTEVWQRGRPVWIDPQWLQGGSEMLDSPHGLNRCPVVGSFALIGRSVSAELVEKARLLWSTSLGDTPGIQGEVGATRLQAGILCRYRGFSSLEARRWFMQVWQLVRLAYLGRPACPPRVWIL